MEADSQQGVYGKRTASSDPVGTLLLHPNLFSALFLPYTTRRSPGTLGRYHM